MNDDDPPRELLRSGEFSSFFISLYGNILVAMNQQPETPGLIEESFAVFLIDLDGLDALANEDNQ